MFGETTYEIIECTFKKATEKAILICIENTNYWIPKSCLEYGFDEELEEDTETEFSIAEWILIKNNII
jgi:hypothetical protein